MVVLLVLTCGIVLLSPQPAIAQNQFSTLVDDQKKLFTTWSRKEDRREKRRRNPEERFNRLSDSERATFAAVSNALFYSQIAGSAERKGRRAIELVESIDMIVGHRPEKGSDEQFRLYVSLKPGSAMILGASLEFKRGRDNTRYHKGFPLNFRQQGRTPTLQFSINKDGSKADIDIDYRSSGFPASLLNGHLTASNSDVRAPGNYLAHIMRWPGLVDYWRPELKAIVANFAKEKLKPLSPDVVAKAQVPRSARSAAAAATEFLRIWLISRDPDKAVNFVGTKFSTCRDASSPLQDPLFEIRLREYFYYLIKAANRGLGKTSKLDGVIEPYEQRALGRPLPQVDYSQVFSLTPIGESGKTRLLCRDQRSARNIGATDLSRTESATYFVTSFKFKTKRGDGGKLSLLWEWDAGMWRIQAFDAFAK